MRFSLPVVTFATAALLFSHSPLRAGDAPPTHGLDLAGMDKSVKPGDDFNRYANGTWMDRTEIPADRSSVGVFSMLAEEANKRTSALIQNAGKAKAPAGSDTRKIADYYAAYMNEAAIEAKGLSPVRAELNAIDALKNKADLSRFLGTQLRADVDALNNTNFHTDRLFGVWIAPDFSNPDRNVAYLMQGGLGMPDRDNYLDRDEHSTALQAKYRDHIASILGMANFTEAENRASRVYALERKIAAAHVSRTDSSDVLKANNPWKTAEFSSKAPGIDWPAFFRAASLSGEPMIMVWQPSAVTGLAALVESEPLAAWKDYLKFHVIDRSSALLPKRFADERFAFYGTALTGATKQRDRWKRAVDSTSGALGEAVGKLYAKAYFPPEAKVAAQKMVENIVAAFGERVDRLTWMSPTTKAKAKEKLGTLYVGVGYPDRWRDYSALRIDPNDALGNAQRTSLFEYRSSLAKLKQPVDRTEWSMTPQTVNAVNLPLQNALNFPAAILSPPFFDASADPALNYGGIGTVIGHEISHSFDDQGAQFDAHGRLLNWWTPEDFAHFTAAGDALAAQYSAYEPIPGIHINGKLTLSENIADVAGIASAYDGYRKAYGSTATTDADGLTPDQRFFLAFAQIWRTKMRPEALRGSLVTNGHAPGGYRALTVRNIDAWYTAFDVKPGDKLYLAPETRVRPW